MLPPIFCVMAEIRRWLGDCFELFFPALRQAGLCCFLFFRMISSV